jgi:hypothetical protein
MRARAVLSILVLIAVVIVAPVVMHARGRDQTTAFVGFDLDPDMPAVLDAGAASVVAVIQTYTIVDLAASRVRTPPRTTPILVIAPKTSPPLV